MLDGFELLQRFLVYTLLVDYFALVVTPSSERRAIIELLLKGRLTTGDWSKLMLMCARALRASSSTQLVPGLAARLLSGAQGRASPAEQIAEFCELRYRHWGHKIGRTDAFYTHRLQLDLPQLSRVLGELDQISSMTLVVPTRLEAGRMVEARTFRGAGEARIESLSASLAAAKDGRERVQVNRSVLLLGPGETSGILFPFFKFSDHLNVAERGLYVLAEWVWARQADRLRLKTLSYVGGSVGGTADLDRDARAVAEEVLLPIVMDPASSVQGDVAALPQEDPDYSIAAVWADRDRLLHHAVGREDVVERLETVCSTGRGGLFILHGGPGTGKSSFSYQLHSQAKRVFPILHAVRAARSPQAFLRSLLHQCSECLEQPLGAAPYRAERVEELRISLEHTMARVAKERSMPCVAIVDGLDELEHETEGWAAALEWLPRSFAGGMSVIVTCRPDAALLAALRHLGGGALIGDMELPLLSRTAADAFVHLSAGEYADQVGKVLDLDATFTRSGGHPLHLRALVEAATMELANARAARRRVRRLDQRALAAGEAELMEMLWEAAVASGARLASAQGSLRRTVLEYLALAGEVGLSAPVLHAAVEQETSARLTLDAISSELRSLSAYLRSPSSGRYTLFHASLGEFARAKMGSGAARVREAILANILLKNGPALDEDYWAAHVAQHVERSELPIEIRAQLVEDERLFRAKVSRRLGASHGTSMRAILDALPRAKGEGLVAGLVRTWSPGAIRFEGLPVNEQEEVASAFEATGIEALARVARDVYAALYQRHDDPLYLRSQAWVSYQRLDDWGEAERALVECIRRLDQDDVVEASRARRQLAGIAFDSGSETIDSEAMLRTCLEVFDDAGLQYDCAITHETLGLVLDAEGLWSEAESEYVKAKRYHDELRNMLGLARVALARSVTALFSRGLGAALPLLHEARMASPLSIQMRDYVHANSLMMTLLSGDLSEFARLKENARLEERWLSLTVAESTAVWQWFSGDVVGAAQSMADLVTEFDRIDDAWGAIDNRINLGFLNMSQGRVDEARQLFNVALESSRAQSYRLGSVIAAEGLARTGAEAPNSEREFFAQHLKSLFDRVPSLFMPCYVLLLP